MAVQQERDALFHKLLLKKDNKHCFDCGTNHPKWTSKTFGVFVCLDCSGIHRSMGVHISFVKSANMDKWTSEELDVFRCSQGNAKARLFFAQHGWQDNERGRIAQKYTSRAAGLYRNILTREVAALHKGENIVSPVTSPKVSMNGGKDGDFFDASFEEIAAPMPAPAPPKPAPAPTGPMVPPPAPPAAKPKPAVKPAVKSVLTGRKTAIGGKKPLGAVKTGGLGIKKLSVKVDDRLFDQAPKEMPPSPTKSPKAPSPRNSWGSHVAPPTQGRFSYNVGGFGEEPAEEEPKSPKSPKSPAKPASRVGVPNGGGGFRSMSAKNDPARQPAARPTERDDIAQSRFGGAKSISSASFGNGAGREESGFREGSQRMAQFSGAGAISSSDYFGDDRRRSMDTDHFDITAGELMSKMSMQAREDVQKIKAVASRGARVIGDFLNDLK